MPQAEAQKKEEVQQHFSLTRMGEMQAWQRKKLLLGFLSVVVIGVVFLACACTTLYKDKAAEEYYWTSRLSQDEDTLAEVAARSAGATQVTVGTYVESLKEINMKSSFFRVTVQVWFSWEGDEAINMKDNFHFYNGYVNKMEVLHETHENGVNYQLLRCDVSVGKDFWTRRFPLESHQLRFYVESEYPVEQVVFLADRADSGTNGNLSVAGYNMRRHDVGLYFNQYESLHGDPGLDKPIMTSEFVTAMEVNRASWGLYAKCFIALVGTITWVLITLFLCTYHRVDPLGMVPAALFGTVSNIMVGANLLPDALQMGLLEYVNIWGILTILAVTFSIININRIRNKYEDREFAGFFGRVMFYTVLVLTVTGNVLMPICAFMY